MRVLILQDDFPPFNLGGAGAIAYASAKELQKRGHEVEVVTTVRALADAGDRKHDNISVHCIYSSYDLRFQAYVSLWNPSVVREVKKIIAVFKPDIVHAHNVHGYLSYASLRTAKLSGARVILTCHDVMPFNYGKFVQYIDPNDFSIRERYDYRISPLRQLKEEKFRYNPFRNAIIRWILGRYVDRVVAVSAALKDALEQNGIKKVTVIHNGIDINGRIAPSEEIASFKTLHGLGNSVVLFSGKPVGVKGGKKLIEAISKIAKEIPDIQLLIPGRVGKDTDIMIEHAKAFDVSERLVFPGWLIGANLYAAYKAASVVVVPSLCFDSLPTMILEAFACKKPVIATCFGGAREIVEDNISGIIINPFDVDTIARSLYELLSSREKAARFGDSGFDQIKRQFNLEQQIVEYEKAYTI